MKLSQLATIIAIIAGSTTALSQQHDSPDPAAVGNTDAVIEGALHLLFKEDRGLETAGNSTEDTNTTVLTVRDGDSIQEAIDLAEPGDVIEVWPGNYMEQASKKYGLHITKDNIKLVAMGEPGGVRLLAKNQDTGVFAAPASCEYTDNKCDNILKGFSITGFSVEGFKANGIQTRWVDDFEFQNCSSVNNLMNGIYPTLSSNGRIVGCKSYGSLDSGLWIAGSNNVTATGNEIYQSTTGFEVTVSKNLYVTNNDIHNNVVGIGLYHPNMAGTNPDYSSYDSWIFENNHVYDNNLPNTAPSGTFQAALQSGIGLLLVGISEHTIKNNVFEDNGWAGIIVAGFCTVQRTAFQTDCDKSPPKNGDPSANFNTIVDNKFAGNGYAPAFGLGADIIYNQGPEDLLPGIEDQNCFKDNMSLDGSEDASTVASNLPYPGCVKNEPPTPNADDEADTEADANDEADEEADTNDESDAETDTDADEEKPKDEDKGKGKDKEKPTSAPISSSQARENPTSKAESTKVCCLFVITLSLTALFVTLV